MAALRLQTLMALVLVTAFLVFILPIEKLTTCRCSGDRHHPPYIRDHRPSFEEVLGKKDIIVYGKEELNKTLIQYQKYQRADFNGEEGLSVSTPLLLRKTGWVVDCVTWDNKWESSPDETMLHDFLMDVYQFGAGEDHDERQSLFQDIYNQKDWPADDPSYHGLKSSGPGAMLKHAQGVVAALHVIITKIKQQTGKSQLTLLDLPCGDMQWMSQYLVTRNDILYTGADIVPQIIQYHRRIFKRLPRSKFIHHDIVKTPLNQSYDLILSRDLLQHLWMVDAMKALDHISASKSSFLLATTYTDIMENKDVEKGTLGSRKSSYNLELTPFSLEPPICVSYDWNVEHIALWPLPLKQMLEN